VSIAASALKEFAGVYMFDDLKVVVTAGDSLVVQVPNGVPPSTLVPMGTDRFFVRGSFSRFTFERNAAGEVVAVTRKAWNSVDKGRKIE